MLGRNATFLEIYCHHHLVLCYEVTKNIIRWEQVRGAEATDSETRLSGTGANGPFRVVPKCDKHTWLCILLSAHLGMSHHRREERGGI